MHRLIRLSVVLAIAAFTCPAAVITEYFTGTISCFAGCSPSNSTNSVFVGLSFSGSYSFDDSVVPTSGDPTTFETYGSGATYSFNIGNGLYTVDGTGGFEIERHHNNNNQDEVYALYNSLTLGGTDSSSFVISPPSGFNLVHFVDSTATNVLTGTTYANWPQSLASWSTGFAGIEFSLTDTGFSNSATYRGAFATLSTTAPLSPTPEPGTIALLAAGLAGLAAITRRRAPRA